MLRQLRGYAKTARQRPHSDVRAERPYPRYRAKGNLTINATPHIHPDVRAERPYPR